MSKIFSHVTLSTLSGTCSEEFIVPGIPQREPHGDGISVDEPGEYARDPDDFFYDNDGEEEIQLEYTAYSYGVGRVEDPNKKELLAIALIFSDQGSVLYDILEAALDVVQTRCFTAINPFWEEEDEGCDEE